MKRYLFLSLILYFAVGIVASAQKVRVKTGIEVLQDEHFRRLEGKRVGLITNPTGVDHRLRSTIDILHEAPNVRLVALYGPEHGVRGNVHAGDTVGGTVDPATGLPIHSLYGNTRKPTSDMLRGIDILVYDIQDIGCRSFTYISTMGLAMEAAAEAGIEFMVLDRPNPLGGERVEGCVVEDGYQSFVSPYPIPYVYGLTCGELARLLNEERMTALSTTSHEDERLASSDVLCRDRSALGTTLTAHSSSRNSTLLSRYRYTRRTRHDLHWCRLHPPLPTFCSPLDQRPTTRAAYEHPPCARRDLPSNLPQAILRIIQG